VKFDEAIKTLKTGDEVLVTIKGTLGRIYGGDSASRGFELDNGATYPAWYDASNTGDGVEFVKVEPTPRDLFDRLKIGAWFVSNHNVTTLKYIKTGRETFITVYGTPFSWVAEDFTFTPTEVEPG
jgi:hypothetical protein